MAGYQIRPDWKKLFKKGARVEVDYSVSPVHEIADDISPTPVSEVLLTGITTEYPTSEIIYTEEGDIVMAVTS